MSCSISKPYLPKHNNGYTDFLNLSINNEVKNISISVPSAPTLEHEIGMWNDINEFEKESWSPDKAGLKSGFKALDDGFGGGIKPGFYIIAADSNVGKSHFLGQLAWQISEYNENVYVMDFSLDDPMDDRIARTVASRSTILINSVKNPLSYTQYPLMLTRRLEGLNNLRKSVGKYKIYDATFSTDIEKIEAEVKKVKETLSKNNINKKIVLCIDSFHDLTTSLHPSYNEKEKYNYLAQRCADIAINEDIAILCTGELRKTNGILRSSADAIRESVKIKYEAKAILICHNDVHYRGEGAEVFFNRKDQPNKQPVFEVHFAKNKFSSFKGRLFYYAYPDMSRMEECNEEESRYFSNLIYSG